MKVPSGSKTIGNGGLCKTAGGRSEKYEYFYLVWRPRTSLNHHYQSTKLTSQLDEVEFKQQTERGAMSELAENLESRVREMPSVILLVIILAGSACAQ